MEVTYENASDRWARLGPYYAMFPWEFAVKTVAKYCPEGGAVLDPFCGRATSVFAAAASGRRGIGIEIHPAGWVYGATKLGPVPEWRVLARLNEVDKKAGQVSDARLDALPTFFRHCFSKRVRRFLLAARANLDWRNSQTDRTLASFILTYLHGKRDYSLSNQLRQAKAMSPEYSIKWWKERDMRPPAVDPVDFLTKRIKWRYKQGVIDAEDSRVLFGDARLKLRRLQKEKQKFDLLFTSPPYLGVTNYHYDQWLRLWVLGFPPSPEYLQGPYQNRFNSEETYRELLEDVFEKAARMMKREANIYIRTDKRTATLKMTREVLRDIFGSKVKERPRPLFKETQTALYGDREEKPGEIDFVLHRS